MPGWGLSQKLSRAIGIYRAVLENNAMVVRYSTIPLSPLAMRHSTINVRLSLVSRAIGRAYLGGMCVVSAAGNNANGFPTRNLVYPARYGRVANCLR